MYARLVVFNLGNGKRRTAEELTKQLDSETRKLRGFRGSVYFFDDRASEYRALNYWDTKSHAEDANNVMLPKLEKDLGKMSEKKPIVKLFEVFDPADNEGLIFSHINI
ncbi:hypothetical protein [Metabacillus bambusae]|uniref:ABM domain-containing protein n=1 Tax=Metabacillus bambusae TaxID=2795218 RepID=A0ABS3MXB9_9BACI|nr:hypothetical protein [Metabacillus bambusae]MBO1510598.1 hypothetical protein [Metabacillus bambusae]